MQKNKIRLTQTVQKGGCAAKLPAGELRKALDAIEFINRPELIVGTESLDDGALWDLGNGQLMIKTLDFFTPIVDDPYDFGSVAAANSLSDVYAMGGNPAVALTILAFPTADLDYEVLHQLMRGAVDKIQESGACLAGGHSIDDDSLKLGFSVTGFVDKERSWVNSNAKPGDLLILTKPLGTGTLVSANKNGEAKEEWICEAINSMKQLNRVPELLGAHQVHAATDITGFSLAGHAMQVAEASGVSLEIDMAKLPSLAGALPCLQKNILNSAHKTNEKYISNKVSYVACDPALRWLTLDPQTSGGLLLSVPSKDAESALAKIKVEFPKASIIGKVIEANTQKVFFK